MQDLVYGNNDIHNRRDSSSGAGQQVQVYKNSSFQKGKVRSCWSGDRESNLASTAKCDGREACMWCSVAPETEGHSRDHGAIECIGDCARHNDACL